MASDRDYLDYVLEQLSDINGISFRAMMGEFVIYCQGKVIGGIYDDRFLVKPTKSARQIIPNAAEEIAYEGAKKMLLVDVDNRELLNKLIPAVASDLPDKKKK